MTAAGLELVVCLANSLSAGGAQAGTSQRWRRSHDGKASRLLLRLAMHPPGHRQHSSYLPDTPLVAALVLGTPGDVQDLAGDEAGLLAAEEGRGGRDVRRLAGPSHRDGGG